MAAPPRPNPLECNCDAVSSEERKVSSEELKAHRSEASCWVLLNGDVWDLTPFLMDHPGGPGVILEYAGRDATAFWESLHPPEVLSQLNAKLRIGVPDFDAAAAAAAPVTVNEQLLHACKMGGSSEIDTLLAAKADPNFQAGQGGEAPLHWAARKGLPVMVAQLLAAGSTLEAKDAEAQTPLLLAARNSMHEVVKALLAAKAAPNAQDTRGETALHAAAGIGSVRIVKMLLAAEGADPSIEDNEGNTAADTASEQGNMAAENLINAKLG